MGAGQSIGNRIAPARYLLFLGLLPAAYFALSAWGKGGWHGAVLAFDISAFVFIASLIPLLRHSTPELIRAEAAANDANRIMILALTTLLTVAAMGAIVGEIGAAQQGSLVAIATLIGTLLLVWTFANSVYALHYAHLFYGKDPKGGDAGGLDFPGTSTPDYNDFAYFAFTLAMTFQTSDVAITSRAMRRIALFHSFAAFLFNIGLIAFTINVLAGSAS